MNTNKPKKKQVIVTLVNRLNEVEVKTIDANQVVVEDSGALTLNRIDTESVESTDYEGEIDLIHHTIHIVTYNSNRWDEFTIIETNEN